MIALATLTGRFENSPRLKLSERATSLVVLIATSVELVQRAAEVHLPVNTVRVVLLTCPELIHGVV